MRNGIGRRMRFIGVVALAGVALPAAGFAYGIEVPENGTTAHGRGGAFVARASDVTAAHLNMAGVLGLQGFQLGFSANIGASSNCFQRSGVYDGSADVPLSVAGTRFVEGPDGLPSYAGQRYPEVCSNRALALAANVMATYRVNRWLAFAAGITTPSTPGSGQTFNDMVRLPSGAYAPTPVRNMLFQKNLLVLYPTLGVAVAPHPRVRFGLTLQPSFARFQFGVMANAVATSPQSPETDLLISLNASGFFLAGALSTQVLINRYLSFGAQVHYNMPIGASGTADTTSTFYANPVSNQARGTFNIDEMKVELPWNARAGFRFALPRAGRPTQDDGTGTYDPMTDDVFDVEADFTYENTSSLGVTSLTNSGNITIGSTGMTSTLAAPRSIVLNSNLSNVFGFRLGGDYNVIPGRLAVRLGFSYETQGLSADRAVVHLPAYAGASIHAGVSYRVGALTINLGFGHFLFQSLDASQAVGSIVTPTPFTDCVGTGPGACAINRGSYHNYLTNGSVGLNYRF